MSSLNLNLSCQGCSLHLLSFFFVALPALPPLLVCHWRSEPRPILPEARPHSGFGSRKWELSDSTGVCTLYSGIPALGLVVNDFSADAGPCWPVNTNRNLPNLAWDVISLYIARLWTIWGGNLFHRYRKMCSESSNTSAAVLSKQAVVSMCINNKISYKTFGRSCCSNL